jgi:hypothetical protein
MRQLRRWLDPNLGRAEPDDATARIERDSFRWGLSL